LAERFQYVSRKIHCQPDWTANSGMLYESCLRARPQDLLIHEWFKVNLDFNFAHNVSTRKTKHFHAQMIEKL
jgi:hypothetical protein